MPTLACLSRNYVFSPPKREAEVPWLPELRFVLTIAKLLAKRNGVRVTRLGGDLLAPDRAGELYALLFRTFFRRMELSSLDGASEHPELQPTLACSLHSLRSQARGWKRATQLSETAWLESAKDPPTASDMTYGDLRYIAFQHRLLDPLVQFGLLEARQRAGDRLGDRIEYRCTPLYDRFLRFQFRRDSSGAAAPCILPQACIVVRLRGLSEGRRIFARCALPCDSPTARSSSRSVCCLPCIQRRPPGESPSPSGHGYESRGPPPTNGRTPARSPKRSGLRCPEKEYSRLPTCRSHIVASSRSGARWMDAATS